MVVEILWFRYLFFFMSLLWFTCHVSGVSVRGGGGGVVELPAVSFKGYSFGLPCVHSLALFTFPYKLPTEPDTVYTRASQ